MLTQYKKFIRNSKPRIFAGETLNHVATCANSSCWCKLTNLSKTLNRPTQQPTEGDITREVIASYLQDTEPSKLTHSHRCRYCNKVWACKIEGYCEYEQPTSKRWSSVTQRWTYEVGEWASHDCWKRLVSVARYIRMMDMASELDTNPYTSKVTEQPANRGRGVVECYFEPDANGWLRCLIPEHTVRIWCVRETGEKVRRSIHAELSRRW